MNTYTPNLTDPRVTRKLENVLGFVYSRLSYDDVEEVPTRTLDTHFGSSGKPLSKLLRAALLMTNGSYDTVAHRCMAYMLRKDGVKYVRHILMTKTFITMEEFLAINAPITEEFLAPTVDEDAFDQQIMESFIFRSHEHELESGDFVYEEKSGRLWNSLQHMPKKFRTPTFIKYGLVHDYDVSTCAPTLLIQHAKKMGYKGDTSIIDAIIGNKTEVRQMLSDATGIPVPAIKVAINGLFAGAKLQAHNECMLFKKAFKLNYDYAYAFKNNQFVQDLIKEINQFWDFLGKKTSSEKWEVYYGLELMILKSAMKFMQARNIKFFAIHDGFVSSKEIATGELEAHIFDETSYVVHYDYSDLRGPKAVQDTQISTNAVEALVETVKALPKHFMNQTKQFLDIYVGYMMQHFETDDVIRIYGSMKVC